MRSLDRLGQALVPSGEFIDETDGLVLGLVRKAGAVRAEVGKDEGSRQAAAIAVGGGIIVPVGIAGHKVFQRSLHPEDDLVGQYFLGVKDTSVGAERGVAGEVGVVADLRVELERSIFDNLGGGIGGLLVKGFCGPSVALFLMIFPPGGLEEAGAAFQRIGGIFGDACIADGSGGADVLCGEVQVLDDVADNYVTGIPVLVHLVHFRAVQAVVEPGDPSVLLELVKIEPGPEPAGNALVVVFVQLRDRAVITMDAVDEKIDGTQVAPTPGRFRFRTVSCGIEGIDALGGGDVRFGAFL